MRRIKIYLVAILLMALATSTSYAAPKDYATLSWVTRLINVESSQASGTIRITITGVVGKQIGKGLVDLAKVPEAYYYTGNWGGPFIGGAEDYENIANTRFEVFSNSEFDGGESVFATKDKLAQEIQNFAAKYDCKKVPVKLIPVVEGATMKIELIDADYLAYYQFDYPAFAGTNPLLLADIERIKAFYMEMWTGDAPQTGVFRKAVNEDGTFRVYQFPVEALTNGKQDVSDMTDTDQIMYEMEYSDWRVDPEKKGFYVVSEAEAKVMMGKAPASVPTTPALPTSSKVLVDGTDTSFEAYNINGNNYFKLRDLAKVINGSEKQFEVGWDAAANAIQLTSKKGYTVVGGELALSGNKQNKAAIATTSKVYIDGNAKSFVAYNINGNNYFKLRDIGKAFNFGIGWDAGLSTITISTPDSYTE